MRFIVIVVVTLVVAGALLLFAWPSGSRPGAGALDARETPAPAEESDAALGRLRQAIARAAPAHRRTDAERLADAAAWVAANRPHDWPYAEIEAWVLADFEAMASAEPRTGAWVMDSSRLEVEMIRAIDADGDGAVSDSEVDAFAAFSLESLAPENHPYVIALFDIDGDGMLAPEEQAPIGGAEATMVRLEGVRERGQADMWDVDGDGLLSAGERAKGEQDSLRHQRIFEDGHIEHVAEPDERTAAESAAALEKLRESFGDAVAAQTLDRQQLGAATAIAMPLAMAMTLVEPATSWQSEPPQMPDLSAFDPDGDGSLDDQQLAAHMAAMEGWEAELSRWRAAEHAARLRTQFESAAAASDTDGDGRLSPAEWSARVDALLAERDSRLFHHHYDLDGSGRVEPGEVDRYLDWYRADSLRADANYDGRVDALDLEQMAASYMRQGG